MAEASFQMDIPSGASDQAPAPDQVAAPAEAQGAAPTEGGEQLFNYPTETLAASPAQAAEPAQSVDNGKGDGQADLLFVQQATTAQLIFDDPNTATDQARLVLHGVSPATTWWALFRPMWCTVLLP